MASYPYYSPPPPPSPPCNNTTSPILLPPPPPSPPPPPPACNHTAIPTLAPPQSPPPPAQSPYSQPPPSLSPPPPTSPQKRPQWGPPPSSNYSQPKSPQPPSSPSPPPPSSYAYYSPPPPSSPCNTTTPTLQPPPPPPPACGCNKATPTLPSPPPPPPSSHYSPPVVSLSPPTSSRSQPPPSPSHPSPPPPPFYHSPPIHSPPPPPPHRSPPSPPPPSSFPPPLHSPPPPPSHPPPQSPPPPPFYYSPPPLPPPSSPPSPSPKPSTPSPSPLSPVPPPCHCVCPSPWATPPNNWATPPNSIAPAPNFFSPSNGPRTPVLATFASLGGLFFLSFIVIGLLSMAEKKGMLPFQFSRLLRRYSIPSGGRPETGPPDLEQPESSNPSGTDKMSSDPNLSKPPREKSVMEFKDAPADHSVTDTADTPQHVEKPESNEVGEESNDSEKKKRLPKIKKPSSSGAKKKKDKHSGISQVLMNTGCRQVLNTGCCLDLPEAEQSQNGDNDGVENQEQRNAAEQETENTKSAQDEGQGSNPVKEESNERSDKPHSNPSETNNTEATQDDAAKEDSKYSKRKLRVMDAPADQSVTDTADTSQDVGKAESNEVGEESNDSEKKPRLPKIKEPSSSGAKKKKDKHSGIRQVLMNTGCRQVLNTGCCLDLPVAEQSQNGDNDGVENQEQRNAAEQETENTKSAQDEGEGSNPVKEESNERSDKPHSNPSETNNTDATQDDAAKEDSNVSKRKLPPPNQGKASGSRRNPQGKRQPSRFGQLLNVAGNICHGAVQSRKNDNDELNDVGELNDGGSNNVDEGVEPGAHEKESDEPPRKPLIDTSVSDNTEAARYEKEPDEGEGKSYESGKKPLHTKNLSARGPQMGKQNPSEFVQALNFVSNVAEDEAVKSQEDDNGKALVQESEAQEDGGELNLGGPNNANEDVKFPSNVHDETPDEGIRRPLYNQSESEDTEVTQDVEQPDAVKRILVDSKSFQKKNHSSRRTGKQKASIDDHVSNAASNVDLDGAGQYKNDDTDEVVVNESGPQNDYAELELGGSIRDQRGREVRTRARSRGPSNLISFSSPASGNDSSRAMDCSDDVEGEVEVSDLFDSARGSQHALSKAMALSDDKAKVHQLKSGGSNKDSPKRQHRTQVREDRKPFDFEQIVTAASGSDPGKALVSFGNEDDNVQVSEPFASNVDSYMRQLHTGARGIEQSHILSQNFSGTIEDDPVEEFKSLGDDDYRGKQAEVYELRKDSHRSKGPIMGARRRIESPNPDQTVTTRIGYDLGKGLESLGGNQEVESVKYGLNKDVPRSGQTSRGTQQLPNLDQFLTATNEGDPNPEQEICEDDRELESECSNKDLSLQEPSPGEIEPSIDDQSVCVDDNPDVLQFHNNEHDQEPAESNKDARPGKPLSRPGTTSLRGKRRA